MQYKIQFGVFDRPRGLRLDSEGPQRTFMPVFEFIGKREGMEGAIRLFTGMFSIDPFEKMLSTAEKPQTFLLGDKNGYRIYQVD